MIYQEYRPPSHLKPYIDCFWFCSGNAMNSPYLNVEELSRSLGISRQHLRRIFHQYVGLAPKPFFQIQRINRLVKDLSKKTQTSGSWADVAQDFGFTDQSHLIKDFKSVIGETPHQYFLQR